MANYSNIEYDPDFFQGEDEDLFGYMQRLEGLREGGVLGTGTGTTSVAADPVTQEVTEKPLGEATYSCPVGYSWDGTRCVPDGSGDSGEGTEAKPTARTAGNDYGYVDPSLASFLGGLFGIGPLATGAVALNNAEAMAAAQRDAGMEVTPLDKRIGLTKASSIGEAGIGDNTYDVSIGGTIRTPSVVERLFGMAGDVTGTSLTPAEKLKRERNALIFDPTTGKKVTPAVAGAAVQDPLRAAEAQARARTMAFLNPVEQEAYAGNGSGYYREPSTGMLFTGGQGYGGWTAVNETNDGNDFESFDGDPTTDTSSSGSPSWASSIGSWF